LALLLYPPHPPHLNIHCWMSEPGNCSVKIQLGSTNSKGLPVLFQGLPPRNATKYYYIYAKGLRMVSVDLTDLQRLHQRGSYPLLPLRVTCCRMIESSICCNEGTNQVGPSVVSIKMPRNCTLSCQYLASQPPPIALSESAAARGVATVL